MAAGLLPDHIAPLVDRLRQGNHHPVSLPDVAALTEVLMRSLESYFRSIDMTLYQECQSLADYINDARTEIASLSPEHADSAQIPRAGQELAAIVQQTESATNIIMESAEAIMSADTEDAEAFQATVHDAVMQIFEACSFQDITGQRISKVVRTLEYVEDRIDRLINILGVQENDLKKQAADSPDAATSEDDDKALLNGPALDGEGIDQSEVDALLNGQPDTEEAAAEAPAPDSEDETEDETGAEEAGTLPENLDAEDIDALFAEAAPETTSETAPETIEEPAPPESPEPPETQETPESPETQAPPKKSAEIPASKPAKKPVLSRTYEENAEAALDAKSSDKTTQADIDALFG